MPEPFDKLAAIYDHWYETAYGNRIFTAELNCLRRLCPACQGRWLEVGVGTGRFARRMGISEGIDPSPAMLELAASRGITAYKGCAEDIPFDANTFDGILLAFTLCFIDCPVKALAECHRVLKANGQLLIGLVPADSAWGKSYLEKKKQGHPIYSHAVFWTNETIFAAAEQTGFRLARSACTLFSNPGELPESALPIEPRLSDQAGFTASLFIKTDALTPVQDKNLRSE